MNLRETLDKVEDTQYVGFLKKRLSASLDRQAKQGATIARLRQSLHDAEAAQESCGTEGLLQERVDTLARQSADQRKMMADVETVFRERLGKLKREATLDPYLPDNFIRQKGWGDAAAFTMGDLRALYKVWSKLVPEVETIASAEAEDTYGE